MNSKITMLISNLPELSNHSPNNRLVKYIDIYLRQSNTKHMFCLLVKIVNNTSVFRPTSKI